MQPRKYVYENEILQPNPNYLSDSQEAMYTPTMGSPVPTGYTQPLVIISSLEDINEATYVEALSGHQTQLSSATIQSLDMLQSPDYLNPYSLPDDINFLDELSKVFAKYEVPLGLITKLIALTEYSLNMIIDDSGSMIYDSDVYMSEATDHVKFSRSKENYDRLLNRWEEAEDRLHICIDILAYIPAKKITISFLNSNKKITLSHKNKSPQQFADEAHHQITKAFNALPAGSTPLYRKMQQAFNMNMNTMHYVFTDGEPSDASKEEMKALILNRKNPIAHPLSLNSCTNDEETASWMKEIEEEAPYVAETDDFKTEKKAVVKTQGYVFPYTRGTWILCQLVGAINPDDLDAIDEKKPFSKKTMDDFMGRKLTINEYRYYFQHHPQYSIYGYLSVEFEREDLVTRQILAKNPIPFYQPYLTQSGFNYMQNSYASIYNNVWNFFSSFFYRPQPTTQQVQQAQPFVPVPQSPSSGSMTRHHLAAHSTFKRNQVAIPQQPQPSAPGEDDYYNHFNL